MKNVLQPIFSLVLLLFTLPCFAQLPVGLHLVGGTALGAPYASSDTEGGTGQLVPGAHIGAEIRIPIFKKITLRTGVNYAAKGVRFQSPVAGKYDVSDGILGIKLPFPLNVKYIGDIDGSFANEYIDFPIYLQYRPLKWLSVGAGYQFSKLIKGDMSGTVDVKALYLTFNDQEFDESELIEKYDQAFLAEIGFHFLKRFELKLRGNIGRTPILTEAPEGMNNPKNYYGAIILGASIF